MIKASFRVLSLLTVLCMASAMPAWSNSSGPTWRDESSPDVRQCPAELANYTYFDTQVIRVVDGDTIKIGFKGKEYSIRFLSIDTPETHFMGKSQGYWGDTAAQAMAQMLQPGDWIRVELDVEKCDKYQRILGYVWKGNLNTNYAQVLSGMAVNYCIWPNMKYCAAFAQAVSQAMNQKKGIWSDPTLVIPYEWRRLERGSPHEKFVANLGSNEVYSPDFVDSIPIPNRIFFMRKSDIHAPYYFVR